MSRTISSLISTFTYWLLRDFRLAPIVNSYKGSDTSHQKELTCLLCPTLNFQPLKWGKMESNHPNPKATDLQSVPLPATEYFPMCDSRLDCLRHVFAAITQFSAGIVILCEDFRYSHIIRERPGHTPAVGFEPTGHILYDTSVFKTAPL